MNNNLADLYPENERKKIIDQHYSSKDKIIDIIKKKGSTYPNEIIPKNLIEEYLIVIIALLVIVILVILAVGISVRKKA